MIDSLLKGIRAILEFVVIIFFYRQIYNADVIKNKSKVILFGLGMGACYFINEFFGLNLYFTILGTLYGLVVPLFVLKGNRKRLLSLYPMMMLMIIMISMCISYALAIVLNIPVTEIYYNVYLSALIDLAFLIVFVLDYLIDKKKKHRAKRDFKITMPIYLIMLVGELCFFIILGAMQYFTAAYNVKGRPVSMMGFIISSICMVYCFGFMFLSAYIQKNLTMKNEKDMLNLYATEQQKHIKLMVEKDADMKKFRHDVKQHMWVISYHMEQNEISKAKEYITQIYENLDNAKVEHYTGVVPIDVVISDKKRIMDEKNIIFNWSGSVQKIPDNIQEYDICTVFIDVLDKAIQACEELPIENRELKLLVEINNGRLYIMEKHMCPQPKYKQEDRHIKGITEKYDGYIVHSTEDGYHMMEIVL
jgi:hypothetical protein